MEAVLKSILYLWGNVLTHHRNLSSVSNVFYFLKSPMDIVILSVAK